MAVVELDYQNLPGDDVFSGIDRLFFIPTAALAGRQEENRAVIEAAAKSGVGYLIYLSFINSPEFPGNPLAVDHIVAEKDLEANAGDMKVLALRSGYYFENFAAAIGDATTLGKVFSASKDGVISQAARADMAEAGANLLLADAPKTGVVTFVGESLTKEQMATKVGEAAGKDVALVELEPEQLKEGMVGAGVPEFVADVFTKVDVETRDGALQSDSTELAEALGRAPKTFDEFIREFLAQ
nr:hypothetical protein [Corynebacterium lactis]